MIKEKDKNNIIAPEDSSEEDNNLDVTLRPKKLTDFVGQRKVKDSIKIFAQAARNRDESLEHVLIYGSPGLGKTTLAHIIAQEMNSGIRVTSGPAIERSGDLASILTNLSDGDVLFIDEIHRLNKVVEEVLYPAMEDYALDLIIGKGPSAKTMRLELPRFTLIGATTRIGLISSPMRDRFGLIHKLDYYTPDEIEQIIIRSAKILKIKLDKDSLKEIAHRSRSTPRIANRLLKRVRDYSQVKSDGKITRNIVDSTLEILEIDSIGLDKSDRLILKTLKDKFSGGPVGVQTLAAATGEESNTICDVYEPYLMQIGFIKRTSKGRVLTDLGYKHLNNL